MKKARQVWGAGDVFLVRLRDDSHTVGQVLSCEPQVLNSVSCAFHHIRAQSSEEFRLIAGLPNEGIFSALFCTREFLDNGRWKVVGRTALEVPGTLFPYEHLRSTSFVGAKVIGSGIVDKFLNAYYGLRPWDAWHDPQYLDGLLISPAKKPRDLIYTRP